MAWRKGGEVKSAFLPLRNWSFLMLKSSSSSKQRENLPGRSPLGLRDQREHSLVLPFDIETRARRLDHEEAHDRPDESLRARNGLRTREARVDEQVAERARGATTRLAGALCH